MMSCPDCELTVVDNDSMNRSYVKMKGDIITEPYSHITCKICGAKLVENRPLS